MVDLHITDGFGPSALDPIPFEHALKRLRSFLTAPYSGWVSYDLASVHPRKDGYFEAVSPWSLLLADALAGQVSISNIASFDREQRSRFAERVTAIPADVDLGQMSDDGIAAVCLLAQMGFKGVWGPKITKVAALYRPRAMPVLDGYIAIAFGYKRTSYSEGVAPRWGAIERTIQRIASWLAENGRTVHELRAATADLVPATHTLTDVRLVDIILWTSQDDQFDRPGSKRNFWLNRPEGTPIGLDDVEPIFLVDHGQDFRDKV